jgi:ribonuclease P protein component
VRGARPTQRIPSAERLRRGDDIRAVRERGVTIRAQRFTVYLIAGRAVRVGVIASRRVGGAVQRNRARRLLREAIRKLRPRFRPDAAAEILISARPPIVGATGAEVQAEMEALLIRQGILDDAPERTPHDKA